MKVYVEQSACTGGGLCESALPSVFVLDEDGLATVIDAGGDVRELGAEEAGGVEVPEALVGAVRDAAAVCPGACIVCVED